VSEMDLEALRRAFAAGPSMAPAPAECPSPATIWMAVRGELPADELRTAIDHLASCPACTEEWRLARSFGELSEPAAAASEPQPPPRWQLRTLTVWLTAAGLAAALGVGGLLWRAPLPALRGGPAAPSAPRLVAAAGEPRPRERCVLRWAGPEGARYDVEVRTLAGRRVSQVRGLAVGSYLVPAAHLAPLAPGTVLAWQVSATLPDGRRSVSNGTFTLH
jgi:hypothetical protein